MTLKDEYLSHFFEESKLVYNMVLKLDKFTEMKGLPEDFFKNNLEKFIAEKSTGRVVFQFRDGFKEENPLFHSKILEVINSIDRYDVKEL